MNYESRLIEINPTFGFYLLWLEEPAEDKVVVSNTLVWSDLDRRPVSQAHTHYRSIIIT